MGGSESRASPEMAVALRGIGVATADFSAITPLSTSERSALQNFVLNGGAEITAIACQACKARLIPLTQVTLYVASEAGRA